MRIRISITEKDIQNGKRGSTNFCPIALAAKRVIGHDVINVSIKNIVFLDVDGYFPVIELPGKARMFVNCFDQDVKAGISPFEFEVELPVGLEIKKPKIKNVQPCELELA